MDDNSIAVGALGVVFRWKSFEFIPTLIKYYPLPRAIES